MTRSVPARLVASLFGLLLAAAAFAGCTAGDANAEDDGETTGATTNVGGDAKAGFQVSGRVTDVSIQPLAGVTVTLLPAGRTVTTDDAGGYAFTAVPPGKHLVRFEKDRYLPAARAVTLTNGSASVDVSLPDAPRTDPFVDAFNVTGFIECAAGVPGHGQEATAGDGVHSSCIAVLPSFGGIGNPTNERITVSFATSPNLTSLRVTMLWTADVAGNALEMTLLLEQAGTTGETGLEYARADGGSPVVLSLDATQLAALKLANGASLQTRTFPGSSTAPAVAVQQDFELSFQLAYFGAPLP